MSTSTILYVMSICLTLMTSQSVKGQNVLLHVAFGGSHFMYFGELAKSLQLRDFNVTILASSRHKISNSIKDSGIQCKTFQSNVEVASLKALQNKVNEDVYVGTTISSVTSLITLYSKISGEEEGLFSQDEVINSLRDANFDFIVTDVSMPQFLLPYILDVPFAYLATTCLGWPSKEPSFVSFVPNTLAPYTDKMGILQRTVNLGYSTFFTLVLSITGMRTMTYADLPPKSQSDLVSRADMCFRLKDATVETPRPQNPNIINIGGIMGRPGLPLADNFENIVSSAENGVVLMCFGTTFSDMPPSIIAKFAEAFAQLKQTVIWKFSKEIPNLPENVKVFSWVPQNDLLAHNNVIAFVTHFGVNSIFEAVYHGVPVVGFPLTGDQHNNGAFVHDRGYGKRLNINSFSPEELVQSIEDVIQDDYRNRMAKASELLYDLPPAGDTAAFWIRHVIKHGSKHLRPHAQDMIWYEYLMLDVLLFTAVVVISFVYVMEMLCRRMFCKRKAKTD